MYDMGVHVAQGKGVDFRVVCPHCPSGLSGLIFKRKELGKNFHVRDWMCGLFLADAVF